MEPPMDLGFVSAAVAVTVTLTAAVTTAALALCRFCRALIPGIVNTTATIHRRPTRQRHPSPYPKSRRSSAPIYTTTRKETPEPSNDFTPWSRPAASKTTRPHPIPITGINRSVNGLIPKSLPTTAGLNPQPPTGYDNPAGPAARRNRKQPSNGRRTAPGFHNPAHSTTAKHTVINDTIPAA